MIKRTFLSTILIMGTIGFLFVVFDPPSHAQVVPAWNPNVSCGALVTTFQNVTGPSGALSGSPWQVNNVNTGGVPNKRALSPPCSITNINGQTVSTLVQINSVYLPSLTSEDCSSTYNAVNGGGPFPPPGTFCDDTGGIQPISGSGSIHVEFDHDWLAKGYCGSGHSPCDDALLHNYLSSGSISLDVQGFVFWDNASSASGGHWELHPFTAWKLSSSSLPLSASFNFSPSNPSIGTSISFTASASGGTSPYAFNWKFGDGATGTGSTVTHAYNAVGIYIAQLTVTDNLGATKNVTQSISVGPNFSISSSPSSLAVQTGSSNTSRIIISSINSFSGTVSLATSVSPSGLTASLNVTSVNLVSGGTASSTLTVSSSNPANYAVNVTGTSGASVQTTTIVVRVMTADFNITLNPTSLTIQPSTTGASTIQLTSLGQFSGTVSVSTTSSPPGLATSLSPPTLTLSSGGSASSTLTVSSMNYGNYTLTITGVSGSLSHSATVSVRVFPSSVGVASDSAPGTTSLYTTGGQKLIQDSAGKMIAVYVDSSGRISLSYDNADPSQGGWSTPVKSSMPTFAYSWPAAVLVSLSSLRIIAVGGSVSGAIVDIPITISRGSGNNVTGFSFGTPVTLDSSGLGKYTAAILLHNNDILAAWGWENNTTSIVKSLRWDPTTGWTSLSGSSTIPDNILVDTSIIQYFVPNMIERPDNHNIYLLANRFVNSGRVAINKASWNGSGWSWGSQNLTYETNASDADDDAVGLSWDPGRSLIVAEYGISGTHTFGVFTITSDDVKTHIDTPTLAVTGDRGWAAIGVQTNTGDYYLFLVSVGSDAGSGTLGYVKMTSGGSWNATITWLNTATDNQVTSLRTTGPNPSLDLLYVEGTTAPASVKFVRLGAPGFTVIPNPSSLSIQAGSTGTPTITLSSLYNFAGTVNLSATVSPSGTAATLTPALVTLTSGNFATSTLSFNPTTTGTYTITILATNGLLSLSATVTVTVTDFNIASSPSGVTVPAGALGASTITVTALNGLTGTVTLSVSASSPAGLSCTLPISVIFGSSPQTTMLSCNSPVANTYTVTVTGTDGTLRHTTAAITFTVVDFSIAGGAAPPQILAGAPGTSTITVTALNGLTGTVTLSLSASTPAGLTCTLPASVTFGTSPQTATLSCSATTANTYTVTLTGTDGTLSHSTGMITFVVVDFTISAGAATPVQMLAGAPGTSTITLSAFNGLTGTVILSNSASTPAGLTCTLAASVNFGTSPQTATLSCSSAIANTYTVTVTGTDGTLSHTTATITFTVVDFALSAGAVSPPQILPGATGTSTITVIALNGLTGTVTLSVSASTPPGLTCTLPSSETFGISPQTGTLSCSASAAGDYTTAVIGTSGTLTHSTGTILLHVVDFSISAGAVSPTQVFSGAPGISTITMIGINSFMGTVTFSSSASTPVGLTCATPNSVTFGISTQTTTLSCSATGAGDYTVTVTGTNSSVSHTTSTILFHIVDFSIAMGAVSPVQILAGNSGTSTITVAALNGLTGTVNLSTSASTPAGLTCTLPASVTFTTSTQTAPLSCGSTAANTYTLTVTGTDGTLSHTATTITFTVVDFTMVIGAVSPAQILAGASGTSTVSLTSLNGLIGTVALSVSASTPSGLICTVPSVTFGTSTQTATLSCSSSTANSYTVTVTGTNGTLSHTTPTITFVVVDFSIAATAATPTQILAGVAGNSTVTLTGLNSFTGIVNLTTNSTSCTLSPAVLTGLGTSALSCSFASAGTVSVTVTGTIGSLSHQASSIFTVQDFAITSSVSGLTLLATNTGTSTIMVTSLNGFSDTLNLATNSTSCTVSPASLTSPANATLSCSFSVAGSILVRVTANSGAISRATIIAFNVQDYGLIANPATTVLNVGAVSTSAVTIGAINGFSGIVSLTTNSTACTFSPSTVAGSGTVSLYCSFNSASTIHVAIAGQSASLSHSTVTTYTVQDFNIAAGSPRTSNVNTTSNSTIIASALNQFSGTIGLSETLPTGMSCGPVTPGILPGSGTALVSCSSATPGKYNLTITATSTNLVHTITLTFSFQDYTIVASAPAASTVFSSVVSTITIASQNGFSGPISLSDILPSGLYCGPISPSNITGSGQPTVLCRSTVAGNYTLTVIAISASLTHSTTITLIFADFSITASVPSVTRVGVTASSTINVTSINHYPGKVFLYNSTPAGLTCFPISPTSLTGSGVATISCVGSSAGNYTLQILGMSGSLTRSSSVTVQISDFSISSSPEVVTSMVGGNVTSIIAVTSVNGYSGTVQATPQVQNATSTGGPNGSGGGGGAHVMYLASLQLQLDLVVNPSSQIIGSGATGLYVLSITIPLGTRAGNYTLTIMGADGQLSHTVQVTLVVTDFTFSSPTNNVRISPGNNATATLSLRSLNGLQGNLNITSTANPIGPITSLSPSSILLITGANTTLMITIPSNVQPGNYTLTIQAIIGTLSHTLYITVQVPSGSSGLLASLSPAGATTTGIAGLLTLAFVLPHSRRDRSNTVRRRERSKAVLVASRQQSKFPAARSRVVIIGLRLPFSAGS